MCNQVEREKKGENFCSNALYLYVGCCCFVVARDFRVANVCAHNEYKVLLFGTSVFKRNVCVWVCFCLLWGDKVLSRNSFFFLYFPQFNCYYCWGKMKLYTLHWKTTRQPNHLPSADLCKNFASVDWNPKVFFCWIRCEYFIENWWAHSNGWKVSALSSLFFFSLFSENWVLSFTLFLLFFFCSLRTLKMEAVVIPVLPVNYFRLKLSICGIFPFVVSWSLHVEIHWRTKSILNE